MEILKNSLIGYLTLYFVIWLHEVGQLYQRLEKKNE